MTPYQSILEAGKLKEKRLGIIKPLKRGNLTVTEIAEDFDVSTDLIMKIKTENGL